MIFSNVSDCDLFLIFDDKQILLKKEDELDFDLERDIVYLRVVPMKKSKIRALLPFAGIHTLSPFNLSSKLFCSLHIYVQYLNSSSYIRFYNVNTLAERGITFNSIVAYVENCNIKDMHYTINSLTKLLKRIRILSFLFSGLLIWIGLLLLTIITKQYDLTMYTSIVLGISLFLCIFSDVSLKKTCTDNNANKKLLTLFEEKQEDVYLLKEFETFNKLEKGKNKVFYKLAKHILEKW